MADVSRRLGVQAQLACADGVDLIQVRERDLEAADLAALVAALVAIVHGTRTRVVVNDRLDVALACGAHGVHLRSDSMSVAAARRLAPAPFLIGRSIHSREEALSAGDADYLLAGAVFPTASKPGVSRWLGLDGLAGIARATHVPVLAIGGISADRIEGVRTAGAAGFAAIGLFIDSVRPAS
jgi:thiamine-phosphate pyrophosphorylase